MPNVISKRLTKSVINNATGLARDVITLIEEMALERSGIPHDEKLDAKPVAKESPRPKGDTPVIIPELGIDDIEKAPAVDAVNERPARKTGLYS
jgi:hypothetical protein